MSFCTLGSTDVDFWAADEAANVGWNWMMFSLRCVLAWMWLLAALVSPGLLAAEDKLFALRYSNRYRVDLANPYRFPINYLIKDRKNREVFRQRIEPMSSAAIDARYFRESYRHQFFVSTEIRTQWFLEAVRSYEELLTDYEALQNSAGQHSGVVANSRDAAMRRLSGSLVHNLPLAAATSLTATVSAKLERGLAEVKANHMGPDGTLYSCIYPTGLFSDAAYPLHDVEPGRICKSENYGTVTAALGLGTLALVGAPVVRYFRELADIRAMQRFLNAATQAALAGLERRIEDLVGGVSELSDHYDKYGEEEVGVVFGSVTGYKGSVSPPLAISAQIIAFSPYWSEYWRHGPGMSNVAPLGNRVTLSVPCGPEFRLSGPTERILRGQARVARPYLDIGVDFNPQAIEADGLYALQTREDIYEVPSRSVALRFRQPRFGMGVLAYKARSIGASVGGGVKFPGRASLWMPSAEDSDVWIIPAGRDVAIQPDWFFGYNWYAFTTGYWTWDDGIRSYADGERAVSGAFILRAQLDKMGDWHPTESYHLISVETGELVPLPQSGFRMDLSIGVQVYF